MQLISGQRRSFASILKWRDRGGRDRSHPGVRAAGVLLIASSLIGFTAAASNASVRPPAGSGRVVPLASVAGPSGAHHGPTVLAAMRGGKLIKATVYRHPPRYTKAQLRQLTRRMFDGRPVSKGRLAAPPHHRPLGPATMPPSSELSNVTMRRNTTIPVTAISGGTTDLSYTQEPSTDADSSATHIFQTGNWYATFSANGGSNWSYLNPFTLFGSGFCCDQVTQYDPATGHQFWLLQFSNHLVIANAPSTALGGRWCYWNITPGWIGQPSTTALDYNDMTITNSNVNIATNFFPSTGGSGSAILRLPKSAMSSCTGFSYRYVTRTDNLTFKLVPGSTTTLYWGSNWGQTNGSSFRVFAWPESSTSYTWYNRTVASYSFFTRNSGQKCGSTDGVVKNWCQYADSRVLGAYLAAGVLGFSFNAKQDSSHPFPYTRIVWFNASNISYIGAGDVWGSWGAIQYLSLAPNASGLVGSEFAWGGGTGGTHYYPGAAVEVSTASAINTSPDYYLWGSGNTCTYNGLYRWGDYLTVRTYKANTSEWIGAGYAMTGGNCGSAGAYAQPHNILFSS
jgi:hypothetical protein